MADGSFVFTDEMDVVSNQLWGVTSAVGACLCFLVVLAIAIVSINPTSRAHLDRVSFRILTLALITNTVFGIVNAIGGSFTGPTWTCGFTIWILQLTLELSSFLIFCIALNLQLVIVHRINGKSMEKFYIIGSVLISLGLTIPPYAAKQYGWDPLVADCWYSSDNKTERLAWQIGTQLFWTMLTVAGEIVTSTIVLVYILKHQAKSSLTLTSGRTSFSSGKDLHLAYATKYRNVIFRIGLYPLASCIFNLTSVVCVLHATVRGGVHDMNDYRILLLSDFLYGGRAVIYACLAATDPAFLNAAKTFIWIIRGKHGSSSTWSSQGRATDGGGGIWTRDAMSVQVELTSIQRDDHGNTIPMNIVKQHQIKDGASPSFDSLPIGASPGKLTFGDDHGMQMDSTRNDNIRRLIEKQRREALERKDGSEAFQKQI